MNKLYPRAVLLPYILVSLLIAPLAWAQTVTNPGFESGSLTGWVYSSSGVSWSATGGNSGPACALFAANQSGHASILQTVTGLQSNTAYKLIAYAHLGSAGKATLSVSNYGGSEVTAVVTSTTTYQPLEVDFTTGASNTSAVIGLGNNEASTVYGDDFSVTPLYLPLSDPTNTAGWKQNDLFSDEFNGTALDTTKWRAHMSSWTGNSPFQFDPANVAVSGGLAHLTTVNENLIPNGDFETGTLANWSATGSATITNYNHPNGEPTGEAVRATYGVKLDTSANVQQLISGLTPNTSYILSGSFKIGTGTAVTLSAADFGGSTVTAVLNSTDTGELVNGSYVWLTRSLTFTTGASGTSAIITVANMGTAGTVFADDVALLPSTLPDGAVLGAGRFVACACIESVNTPPFGYYEARMKPSAANSFSAFWFWYARNGSNAGEEIDVAEEVGAPTHAQTDENGNLYADDMKITTHYFPNATTDYSNSHPANVSTQVDNDFHVYGVDWEADSISFYFDGVLQTQFTNLAPPTVPTTGQTEVQHLNWLEFDTEVQSGYGVLEGSSEFQVDYIRAWTK